jgi:hypothetical protein
LMPCWLSSALQSSNSNASAFGELGILAGYRSGDGVDHASSQSLPGSPP